MLSFFKNIVFFFIIIILFFSFMNVSNKDEILNQFAENLYNHPLPQKTTLLEKVQFDGKNWVDGGGSGGYWYVVASMKMTTELSKKEIVNYYNNVQFPYPKSKKLGVETEIYFEDDIKKTICEEGFYYRKSNGKTGNTSKYFKEINELSDVNKSQSYTFIVQIISAYDYLKLD